MCKLLPKIMVDHTRVWFEGLPPQSIKSWDDIEVLFKQRFHTKIQDSRDTAYLLTIRQKERDPIREFAARFAQERLKVDQVDDAFLISAFRNGISAGSLNQELAKIKSETAKEMWKIVYNLQKTQQRRV